MLPTDKIYTPGMTPAQGTRPGTQYGLLELSDRQTHSLPYELPENAGAQTSSNFTAGRESASFWNSLTFPASLSTGQQRRVISRPFVVRVNRKMAIMGREVIGRNDRRSAVDTRAPRV